MAGIGCWCVHVVEIRLIAHERHVRHGAALECPSHQPEPVLEVLEALVIRDVVAQEHSLLSKVCAK